MPEKFGKNQIFGKLKKLFLGLRIKIIYVKKTILKTDEETCNCNLKFANTVINVLLN